MRKIFIAIALMISSVVMADNAVSVSNVHVGKAPAGYPAVMGVAHNNTKSTLQAVFVTFNLYDASGAIVGNAIGHGQNIGPGEDLKFSAPVTVPFVEAKLTDIKTY